MSRSDVGPRTLTLAPVPRPDEDAAIDSLVGLVESGLGEPGAA